MAQIVLINPPSPYLTNDAAYPPMSLLYLAGKIEQLGHEVNVIDLAGGQPFRYSDINHADLVGFTCTTPNVKIVRDMFRWVAGCDTLVGGAHPTFMPQTFSSDGVTIVRGEGEHVIKDILNDFRMGGLKSEYTGGFVPVWEVAKPARHLVDLRRYAPGGWMKSTVIYTSRGCPYSCRFCSKTSGQTYRPFALHNVLDEVNECIGLGFSKIVFGDDNLSIDQVRLKDLLTLLKPLKIEYRLNQDARGFTPELAALAQNSGCIEVSFGIESGSQKMLDAMNKRVTKEQLEDTIRIVKTAGVQTKAYLVLNFPGESEETIQETLEFLEKTRPDKVLVSHFAPLPGSYVWNHPHEFGIDWLSSDWADYYLIGRDGQAPLVFTTKELTNAKQQEHRALFKDGLRGLGYCV